MKIKNIDVKVSAISVAAFVIFTLILLSYILLTGDMSILFWGVPSLVLLLIIPMALNYLSQNQYNDLIPVYEKEAKTVGIKAINIGMKGEPVRVQGVVEAAHFKYLNRPQFVIADRSGSISAKMFTSSKEDINKGDVVEVLGLIIKRYLFTGDAIINCISIRKIDKVKKS
ncbi:MAG: nucleotide-binding protein [Euryarchaeota archaeon]|nr:nucleotide-binding protein [Euryarchaeota archaeon]